MRKYQGKKWNFNLPKIPWPGGFFEILIKSVKRCLKKLLKVLKVDYKDLLSILVEIQRVINNRLLTYNYNDVDCEPLTPNHLGRSFDVNYFNENGTLVEMNQFVEESIERFWKLWNEEHLGSLHERYSYVKNKNHMEKDMICVGEIVLVSENSPEIKWKFGLVEELIRVKNIKIRGASVLMKNKDSQGIIRGPINNLYKFESSGSKATVQLKLIEENEMKNVTSNK